MPGSFPAFQAGVEVDEEGVCREVADADDGRPAIVRVDDCRQGVGVRGDVAIAES